MFINVSLLESFTTPSNQSAIWNYGMTAPQQDIKAISVGRHVQFHDCNIIMLLNRMTSQYGQRIIDKTEE